MKRIFLCLVFLSSPVFAEDIATVQKTDNFCSKPDKTPLVVKEETYKKEENYFTLCSNENCDNARFLPYYKYTRLYLTLDKNIDASCLQILLPNKVKIEDRTVIISNFNKSDLEKLLPVIQNNPAIKIVSFNRANAEVNLALSKSVLPYPYKPIVPPPMSDDSLIEDIENQIVAKNEEVDEIDDIVNPILLKSSEEELKQAKTKITTLQDEIKNNNLFNDAKVKSAQIQDKDEKEKSEKLIKESEKNIKEKIENLNTILEKTLNSQKQGTEKTPAR